MFGEFMLVFLVFFSSATFFFTYRQGLYDQGRRLSATTHLTEEINTINLAFHFIPFETEDFQAHRSCDSVKAREERREQRRLIYEEAQKKGVQLDQDFIYYEPVNYTDSTFPSYLNYCNVKISEPGIHYETVMSGEYQYNYYDAGRVANSEEYSKRVKGWLLAGKKDSVLHVLQGLKNLLIKYDVSHRFDPAAVADSVFTYTNFSLGRHYFNTSDEYDESGYEYILLPFINSYDLTESIEKVHEIRQGFWQYEMLLGLLYYALGAAIVVYSFRMMKIRIWFAALVGIGIWAILLGLLFNLTNLKDEGVFYVLLFLCFVFLFVAVGLIQSSDKKFISGLAFLWAMWSQLAVLPLIMALLTEYYRFVSVEPMEYSEMANQATYVGGNHPVYTWIKQNTEALFTGNLVFFLILLVLIYIPLARKWQANPEE